MGISRDSGAGGAAGPIPNPPLRAGEGVTLAGSGNLMVAYHAGPPAITFFGMDWTREWAQEVTPMQWQGMQLRGDFKEFDFRVVGSGPKPARTPGPFPARGRGEDVSKGD